MVYIPGLGSSSWPGGLAGVPGADGAAGTDAPLGGAGYLCEFDDFVFANSLGWSSASSGGTFVRETALMDSANKAIGVISLGAVSVGNRYTMHMATALLLGGFATIEQEIRVYLPTLSTGAQRYVVRIGFSDVFTHQSASDGVYFEYLEGTSNNWRYGTASNSSRTETSSSIPVVAGAFIKLKIVFAPALASFYVDGVLAGTIATNLPTVAGRFFMPVFGIYKTVGSTERNLNIDYHKLTIDWTVDR